MGLSPEVAPTLSQWILKERLLDQYRSAPIPVDVSALTLRTESLRSSMRPTPIAVCSMATQDHGMSLTPNSRVPRLRREWLIGEGRFLDSADVEGGGTVPGRPRYHSPDYPDLATAKSVLTGGDGRRVAEVLTGLALHHTNRRWIEAEAVRLAGHSDPKVRMVAATALGHLARRFGKIDEETVLPALRRLLKDPQVRGRAEDAMDDIAMFCRVAD